MLVRSVEFQEHFARVQLEGARLQDILQRSSEQATARSGLTLADQQVLDQSRPMAATQTENPIVDAATGKDTSRQNRGGRRRGPQAGRPQTNLEETLTERPGRGRHIDFII